MGVNAGATAVVLVISFVITILLGFGTFGQQWMSNSRGGLCEQLDNKPECCANRSIHSCTHSFGLLDIDSGIYGMVLASFIMCIVVTSLFFMGGWCWCSNFRLSDFACCKPLRCHRWFGTLGGYLLWLCPLAGVLSFAGCMLILSDYRGAPFDYSFYLCVTSSCLLLIASFALIVFVCCRRNQYISEIRSRKYGGAGRQTSGGTDCMACVRSINAFLLAGDVSDDEEEGVEY